jgi:hypothetical protein
VKAKAVAGNRVKETGKIRKGPERLRGIIHESGMARICRKPGQGEATRPDL